MSAGYSARPLWKKLGLQPGTAIYTEQAPDHYRSLFGNIPPGIKIVSAADPPFDAIHFFTRSAGELRERLPRLKKMIKKSGMIWISWPKRTSRVPTDVTEEVVRELALEIGLVDVKVCAVDSTWSGLKLVFRLRDRLPPPPPQT